MKTFNSSNIKYIITDEFDKENYVECGVLNLRIYDEDTTMIGSHIVVATNKKAFYDILSLLQKN